MNIRRRQCSEDSSSARAAAAAKLVKNCELSRWPSTQTRYRHCGSVDIGRGFTLGSSSRIRTMSPSLTRRRGETRSIASAGASAGACRRGGFLVTSVTSSLGPAFLDHRGLPRRRDVLDVAIRSADRCQHQIAGLDSQFPIRAGGSEAQDVRPCRAWSGSRAFQVAQAGRSRMRAVVWCSCGAVGRQTSGGQTWGKVGALAEVKQPVAHALVDVGRRLFRRFECLDAVQRHTAPRAIQCGRLVGH